VSSQPGTAPGVVLFSIPTTRILRQLASSCRIFRLAGQRFWLRQRICLQRLLKTKSGFAACLLGDFKTYSVSIVTSAHRFNAERTPSAAHITFNARRMDAGRPPAPATVRRTNGDSESTGNAAWESREVQCYDGQHVGGRSPRLPPRRPNSTPRTSVICRGIAAAVGGSFLAPRRVPARRTPAAWRANRPAGQASGD